MFRDIALLSGSEGNLNAILNSELIQFELFIGYSITGFAKLP